MMGNANHFRSYAKNLVEDPKQLEYATRRFVGEVDRLCGVMDAQLSAHRHLAGADYGIADMASWPWAMAAGRVLGDGFWEDFPHLKRWVDEVGARPAVERGWQVRRDLREQERSEEEERRRRELLFNQTNEKVREARERAARDARS
jgi:glutathione S-transferase